MQLKQKLVLLSTPLFLVLAYTVIRNHREFTAGSVMLSSAENTGVSQGQYRRGSAERVFSGPPSPDENLSEEVTVVTAYINIGRFQKGEGRTFFTPDLYHRWMEVFARISNPVIAFLESDEDAQFFTDLRKHFPANRTRIVRFARNDTWAFSLRPRIAEIFQQPGYPKHHPNTVVPDYSCAMHAKYEFMRTAAGENPFRTKYISWLDIGLFREIVKRDKRPFHLTIPPNFQEDKVAYNQVYSRNTRTKAVIIFRSNSVWVCGCYFVATTPIMSNWTDIYMKSVEYYISKHLMNTDQQVLYSLFNEKRSAVQMQEYKSDGRFNAWFNLGFLSRVLDN